MKKYNDISIKDFNTFNIDVKAKCLIDCETESDVFSIVNDLTLQKYYVLGGGSNVLFMSDFNGYIVRPLISGLEIVKDSSTEVWVKVGSGVVWDEFVEWTVKNGYYGAENLSAIPGNVGASPVQNIGAYGAEVANIIEQVNGIQISTKQPFKIKGSDCQFAYRDSIFKKELKGDVIITNVIYKLQKKADLKLGYGDVSAAVESLGGATLANVRQAIIDIRKSKLPDPKVEGNAGSFFKNPEIDSSQYAMFIKNFPQAPSYALPNGRYKIPAGWLIEQSGWKGRVLGRAGVHSRQALVLVNKGGATGQDVMNVADAVVTTVRDKFGIEITMEVNMV